MLAMIFFFFNKKKRSDANEKIVLNTVEEVFKVVVRLMPDVDAEEREVEEI